MHFARGKPIQSIDIKGDNYGDIVQNIIFSDLKGKNPLPRLGPTIETYIGHNKDLENVYNYLVNGKDVIIITGLGGIGKTEFAKYFGNKYYSGKSYYLDFRENIIETFLNGSQYDLFRKNDITDSSLDRYSFFTEMIRKLCDILDKENILIIDNVTNLEHINEVFRLPCHVMLTTRRSCESINLSTCVRYNFPLLNEQECVEMFQSYYNMGMDTTFTIEEKNDILEIVRLVNCHTLTIELLAKTCSKACMSVTDMLNRLKKYGFSLGGMKEAVTKNNDIESKTFLEHMQALFDVTDILALNGMRSLLKQLSVLRLEGLSVKYLRDLLKITDMNMLYELSEYGWIKIQDGQVYMNNVVSEIIQLYLKPAYYDLVTILKTLNLKLEGGNISDKISEQYIELYMEQAIALLQYLKKNNRKIICDISARLGEVLYYKGRWEESKDYFTRFLNGYKKCFYFNLYKLTNIYSNIGRTYKALGKYDIAMKYYNKALFIGKLAARNDVQIFGRLYYNMAAVYYQDGKLEKSIELLNLSKAIKEKEYEDDDIIMADTYNGLGLAYRKKGDYKTAKYYFEKKVLPVQYRVYGENTFITAETINNLAGVYRKEENYPCALELYEKALEIRKRLLGLEHPDTAGSYNNIGLLYLDIKEWEIAIKYLNQSASIYEGTLGNEHVYTATVYHNIARAYMGKKDYCNAIFYELKAKDIKEKAYSPSNPWLVNTYEVLSQAYEESGNLEEAEVYRRKVEKIRELKIS